MKRNGKRLFLCTACFLAVFIAFFLMPYMVSASSFYPSDQTVTDQKMVFTKSATWKDQTHAGGSYGAEVSLKVENVEPAERKPVDVAVILCSSSDLNNSSCSHPSHKTWKEDFSESVKNSLANDWFTLYLPQLPDPTNFTDDNIKSQNPEKFVAKVTINGVSGYLCPFTIYTQEYGTDYKDEFKKRANWGFVTQNPASASSRLTLHMEENNKIVGQAIALSNSQSSGRYTLNVSGKSAAAANCTSGAANATLSAKGFVDTVLRNHSSNNIALIPYGVYVPYPEPGFTSQKDTLYSQIEEAYEQPRAYRTSKDAFQSAMEVLDKQTTGRSKAAVFLTDYNIRRDTMRDEAISIAGQMREQGIPVYVMGYGVSAPDAIQQYLKPFAFDYDKERPEADCDYLIEINRSDYGLKEGFQTIAQKISGQETNLTFTDYISEYFQVDRTQLPGDFQVQEETITDGATNKTLEKVTVGVKTSELNQGAISSKIPVTLKEPYRTSSDYLNTNYIFQAENRKGAEVRFWDSTGTYRNIGGGVDSPYLQPAISVTPPDPDVKTAKLTFDLQGGNSPQGQKHDPVTVPVGTKISEAPGYSLIPVRDNYVFGGWFKEPECMNPVGITLMPEKDTTIYARWMQNGADLIYSANGGVLEDGSSLQPELVTIGAPIADAYGYKQNLKREGYQFEGWYMDSSLNTPVGTNTMPDQTTTIYAKWEKLYYLYYDLQGGESPSAGVFDPEILKADTLLSEARDYNKEPVREGYRFDGWFLESECTTPVGDTKMSYENDITIYAKWTSVEEEEQKKNPEDPKKDPEDPKKDPEDPKKDPEATEKPEEKNPVPNPNKNAVDTPSQEKAAVKQSPDKTHAQTTVKSGDLTRGTFLYLFLCSTSVILAAVVRRVVVGKKKH